MTQWLDHFDRICGLSEWNDVQVTEGWNIQTLEVHDISQTYPGRFVMMPYTVTWYADYRGPLFFRYAHDDFILTGNVRVTNRDADDIPSPAYSLGGLMVRNPKTLTNGAAGWIPNEEDYVFLSIGNGSNNHPSCSGCPAPHFEVKSTINSNSNLNLSSVDTNEADIRLIRLHPYVLVLYRHPGGPWIVHRRYNRNDLQDTLQVGMVTYTDWNKASTYTMPFQNSHVLNEDLNPDPSNNPGLPFSPDIITSYDFLEVQNTSMPAAWAGLNLTNPAQVSDAEILLWYGDAIPVPMAGTQSIWLGGISDTWSEAENWISGNVPGENDTVMIMNCDCPAAHAPQIINGSFSIGGLTLESGAQLTIASNGVLEITGMLENEGEMNIEGILRIHYDGIQPAYNHGTITCMNGGVIEFLSD